LRPLLADLFNDRGTVLLEILSKGMQEVLAVPVAGSFRPSSGIAALAPLETRIVFLAWVRYSSCGNSFL
jgi:hypothetical protein